jgi:hypothetical protein
MNLVDRVKNILLTPSTEWPVIDAEAETTGSLYTGYIIPLAAVPVIAWFLGMTLFGFRMAGLSVHVPLSRAFTSAVVMYVMWLVMVFVLGLIIDALAPTFGGTKNLIQALKVAAYSCTAGWVAGIFALIPALAWLGILGLYGLYLLYLGLPILMKSPKEKAVGYTVVVIVCAIVLTYLVGMVSNKVLIRAP